MAENERVTRRGFRVTGRVQGVGFRFWTRRVAEELGLEGSVRNMPDGSVEVQVVGPSEEVSRLRAALGTGPPAGRVTRVETIPADPSMRHRGFVISG